MSASRAPQVAIVGAGPCGLACGRELARLGHDDWTIYERNDHPGGAAASFVDPSGFTWDHGGHVVFSHYGEFDALLEETLGDDVHEHERSSYVLVGDRWVPYPFQNNLRHLAPEDAYDCLLGLIEAPGAAADDDFGTWMQGTFGEGITERFMRPYNTKVWAVPPEHMSASWIAERVSVPDHRRALRNVVLGLDDAGWGPNNTFRFPRSGGTGEIYRRLAGRFDGKVAYGSDVVGVDAVRRELRFGDGRTEGYELLVSTMPLDLLVAALDECPDEVREAGKALQHNSAWIVGVGYELPLRDDRSWLYFADPDVPFYRATNFAKYAPANVPNSDTSRFCSYMTESSTSERLRREREGHEQRVLEALVSTGLVPAGTPVASVCTLDVDYAYPIPTRDRDRALAVVQPWLMERGIFSRGRFGAWRYEIGNMDHAAKMGIDAARNILEGRPEEIWAV